MLQWQQQQQQQQIFVKRKRKPKKKTPQKTIKQKKTTSYPSVNNNVKILEIISAKALEEHIFCKTFLYSF